MAFLCGTSIQFLNHQKPSRKCVFKMERIFFVRFIFISCTFQAVVWTLYGVDKIKRLNQIKKLITKDDEDQIKIALNIMLSIEMNKKEHERKKPSWNSFFIVWILCRWWWWSSNLHLFISINFLQKKFPHIYTLIHFKQFYFSSFVSKALETN